MYNREKVENIIKDIKTYQDAYCTAQKANDLNILIECLDKYLVFDNVIKNMPVISDNAKECIYANCKLSLNQYIVAGHSYNAIKLIDNSVIIITSNKINDNIIYIQYKIDNETYMKHFYEIEEG